MKRLITVVALAVALGCSDQSPDFNVSGTWLGETALGDYMRLTLVQDGETVSGKGVNIGGGTRELRAYGKLTGTSGVGGDIFLTLTVVGVRNVRMVLDGVASSAGIAASLDGGPYVDDVVLLDRQ